MIKFAVTDPIAASEMGEWCNQQFGEEGWDLWTQDLFSKSPTYKFEIFTERDALMFSLKWAEYV